MSGPLPQFLAPLAWPASLIYGAAVRLRTARLNAASAWQASVPVISVGNITAGGTGKSPMVRWIVQTLRDLGRAPAIVLRGHRGGAHSDEALEHHEAVPEVMLGVGTQRRAVITELLREHPHINAIVLDDGFQHRAVARDFDLVLVDATRPSLHDALLPMGWLREPAASLRRADAVVVTRAMCVMEELAQDIQRLHGQAPLAWTDHRWKDLRMHQAGKDQVEAVTWLRGRRVAVWAGLGNPSAFIAQLQGQGAVIAAAPTLGDHHRYTNAGVAALLRGATACGAEAIVCTEKDWVKVRTVLPAQLPHAPIVRPTLQLGCVHGGEGLRAAIFKAVQAGDLRRNR